MAAAQIDTVIRQLRRAVLRQDAAGRSDGQLLASFIDHKDEAAFEALVRRHGPMVFGVCRRVVGSHHDAEDAFQATFLVLARKAASIVPRERLASWLHGVALRTALKAKAMTAKRRGREKQVTEMPEPEAIQHDPWLDLQALLDQELNGLPENYRLPILLCDLEGKTIKEAARQLGWPQGTMAGRLARGRKLLAKRLANRGVVLSAGFLAAVVSKNGASAGVPTALMSSTIKAAALVAAGQAAATGVISVKIAALTEGVLKAMLLSKLKTTVTALLVLGILAFGGVVLTDNGRMEGPQARGEQPNKKTNTEKQPSAKNDEQAKSDYERLQGTWKAVFCVDNGKKDESMVGIVWTFKDKTIKEVTPATKKSGSFTWYSRFRLDEKTNPRQIDILTVKADDLFDPAKLDKCFDDPGERNESIYSIVGDILKICVTSNKGKRPTAFESESGSDNTLIVFKREKAEQQKEKQKNETITAFTSQDRPTAPQAAAQREYAIVSRLMEAGEDGPNKILDLPKATVKDGQLVPIHITDGPENLLAKVIEDEKIKMGTFLDVRVKRLGPDKVRLFLSFQRNELEKLSVSEVRVIGNSVQTIQDVELHKPAKIVFQKDAKGAALRWVEITVDGITEEKTAPPAATESRRSDVRASGTASARP